MKLYKIGNTEIEVYSSIVDMTQEERKDYFEEEIAKENPKFMRVVDAIHNCYKKYD